MAHGGDTGNVPRCSNVAIGSALVFPARASRHKGSRGVPSAQADLDY